MAKVYCAYPMDSQKSEAEYQRHIDREGSEQYNQHPDGCYYCGSAQHHSVDCQDRD